MSATAPPRRTRQRAAVAQALASGDGFQTAQQVHELLSERAEPVALATVYRTLAAMAEAGELDAIRTPEGQVAYRHCADAHVHHHHLICRECGHSVEVDLAGFEQVLGHLANAAGFTDVDHPVELYGLCRDCTASS